MAKRRPHVDERIEIGEGLAIAQLRPLNLKSYGLAFNALNGGALLVNSFVS